MAPDAARVIFLHNPRTGGITLRNALRRQFRNAPLYIPKDAKTRAAQASQMADRARARPDADELELTRSLEAVAGAAKDNTDRNSRYIDGLREAWPDHYAELPLVQEHLWFGLHDHLPGASTYITLIRDPVERAVSIYFHHLRGGRVRRSLEEYLRSIDVLRDNGQTLRVSGGSPNGGYETTVEMLEVAKRNLLEHFAWVGVTERFADSVVQLRRTFGWRPLYFRHQNGAPRTASTRLDPDLLALVRERNQLDLELHRFAGELLESRIAADSGHAEELARFQQVNPIMGPLVGWRISARDAKIRTKGKVARVLGVGRS
jgi:hypothetical protein